MAAGRLQLVKDLGAERSRGADTRTTRMSSKGLLGTRGPAEGPAVRLLWLLTGPDVPMRQLSRSSLLPLLPFPRSTCNAK